MANPTITNIDPTSVVYSDPIFERDTLTFSGADVLAPGTILGRVTASGKLVPFATAGANGSENPVAVLTYTVTSTGSGDIAANVLVGGVVRKQKLIVDLVGDISTLTQAHVDKLRAAGVTAVTAPSETVFDNA